jgi:hypothetical protein
VKDNFSTTGIETTCASNMLKGKVWLQHWYKDGWFWHLKIKYRCFKITRA